ncbi:MAG: DUF3137 domain-containing protein [Rhodospirillaceae bacterium]|nr:DUF3137 domain-containing protein [Rhodospirillaceae bacterium]
MIAITVVVIALLQVLAHFVFGMSPILAAIIFGAVPAFLGGGGAWLLLVMLRAEMKAFLLPKICERLKLRYTGPSPEFPFAAFGDSGLLPRCDRHTLEDGIENAETGIAFAAVEARLMVRKGTTKSGSPTYKVIWRGLLFAARLPRTLKGATLVMPARGFVARLFESRPAERIELGLGSLEAGLEIHTTHAEEARFVLTERVMRHLDAMGKKFGPDRPSLALLDHRVLLALRSKRDRFEGGSLFRPLDDPVRLEGLLFELADVFELADALGAALRLQRAAPPSAAAETSHP